MFCVAGCSPTKIFISPQHESFVVEIVIIEFYSVGSGVHLAGHDGD